MGGPRELVFRGGDRAEAREKIGRCAGCGGGRCDDDDDGAGGGRDDRPAEERETAPTGTQVDAPAWSPDGSRIAFSTGNAIKLVHPDGTNLRTLTSSPVGVINNYPDWSPDSQKIAFITNRYRGAQHSELVTLPRSGAGEPFRVSYKAYPQGIFYVGVAWSPDGKKIAALQFNRNALPDPEDSDERFKVRGYLPDGSYSYSLSGPLAGDDGPEGLDWAPKVS
ncbi:hypothetical protein F1D05_32885 [Kribbella qitaiheensis]|uniref:Dipeptidylpeptidase IV N-terminal domain-containing protein n=1 Tax=Kribbella qitaiheensis TaxID=1544730 RepID=A0A7G6X6H4_9ACTN|nr:PD40 domain-containing protein [Kribbella qitaiheensis]QNE21839.1 hypothetical protein F1D05_32885 [Kribbella qitaiheensis]